MDKEVKSFEEVDFSGLKFPCIAVYYKPDDYPEMCVARVYDAGIPTDTYMIAEDLWTLNYDIEKHTPFSFTERGTDDVPSLVGAWF